MRRSKKVVITCAVTGGAPFNKDHPSFPVTPKQIASECIQAADAGAAVVHIHARDPETAANVRKPKLFKEIVDRIRDSGRNVLINLTGGGGAVYKPDPADEGRAGPGSDVAGLDERMEPLELCEPEIASIDINTSNQVEGTDEFVYLNTTRTLRGMAKRYQAAGIKPELEAFSAGDIEFGKQLVKEGLIDGVPMFQFVLGVKWQDPADTLGMLYLRDRLPGSAIWGALGIGRDQMPVAAQTAILGGNIRVGLEDNLYLRKGVFATNADLVTHVKSIIENLGYEVASTNEARTILGVDHAAR